MISFSTLLLDASHDGDRLRYKPSASGQTRGAAAGLGPVVVWNCTRACNLACRHCYAAARPEQDADELSTDEAKALIDSLVAYHVPALLISGGEPLMRPDLLELLDYSAQCGLRTVISTNGTLITPAAAQAIKKARVSYVGISLDGLQQVNDQFRGHQGAYAQTLQGFDNCRAVGQKTGLRLSLSRTTFQELPAIFDLIEARKIERVCLYHLVYSGRGAQLKDEELTAAEKRQTLDFIIEKTLDFGARNIAMEILTVDNHCDAIYLYLYMKQKDPVRAQRILELLTINGGNRSGVAIGAIDWKGEVYIDQFTRDRSLGNIRRQSFADIWNGEDNSFLTKLRDRRQHLTGRCAACRWLPQCNGNFRARAASTGDFWSSDPACYLTDEEIFF